MADNKIEKALYGPSTMEVALGAILGLLVGVLGACLFLVFKPVQSVKAVPKEPVKGVVYYVSGSDSAAKAKNLPAKLKTLLAGGTALLNEEELNVWSASLGAPAAKPAADPAAAPKPAAPPEGFFSATALNFRLVGDKLQVGTKVTLNYFGLTYDVTSFATGRFARHGDTMAFEPESLYLGSCPLHKLPAASAFIAGRVVASQKIPDDIRAAWAKVTEAAVENSLLKLTTTP